MISIFSTGYSMGFSIFSMKNKREKCCASQIILPIAAMSSGLDKTTPFLRRFRSKIATMAVI